MAHSRQSNPWGSSKSGDSTSGSSTGAVGRGDLAEQEKAGADGSSSASDPREGTFMNRPYSADKSRVGRGFKHEAPGRLSKIKGRVTNFSRRRIAILAVTGLVGGGGIFAGSILSGPFQFVHLAQNLQKHFKSNEDSGNSRSTKVLYYALTGQGAHKGRLGVVGNTAANKWEKRLLEEAGMRPVYSGKLRRFAGLEIVDANKAGAFAEKNNAKLERAIGQGAKHSTAIDGGDVYNADGKQLEKGVDFFDARGMKSGHRRALVRSVVKATGINNVSGALISRLEIKRGGVNFHVLNRAKDWNEKSKQEAERKIKEEHDKNISDGTVAGEDPEAGSNGDNNKDGKPDPPGQAEVDASSQTKKF